MVGSTLCIPATRLTTEMDKTISNYWLSTPGPKQVVVVFDGVIAPKGLESLSFLGESLVYETVFPRRGPASGRNLAAKRAHHETLIFCDSDVVVPKETFQALGASEEYSIYLPAVLPIDPKSKSARFFSDFALSPKVFGDQTLGVSACFSLSRDLFLKLGGFSEAFTHAAGEDWEMYRRFQDAGVSVFFDNNQAVFHTNPTNPLDLARRAFRYGRYGVEQLYSYSHAPGVESVRWGDSKSIRIADLVKLFILLIRHVFLMSMTIGNDKFETRLRSNAIGASQLVSSVESRDGAGKRLRRGKLATKTWKILLRFLATIGQGSQWNNVVAIRKDLSRNDLQSYRGLVLLWRVSFMCGFMSREAQDKRPLPPSPLSNLS